MESIKIPEGIIRLFEAIFINNWRQKQELEKQQRKTKFARIEQIEARMNEIEQTISTLKISKLKEKIEEERANLDSEKEVIESDLTNKDYNDNLLLELVGKIKTMFINPLGFRELGNHDMRRMLIDVRFGGNLYYSKVGGYRTKEKTGLHQYFQSISATVNPSVGDDEYRTRVQKARY